MDTKPLETDAPGVLEVTVTHAYEVDGALAEAIEVIQTAATKHQTGILVTRIAIGRYVVRAHPAVPFGLVRQRNEPTPG